MGKLFMIMILVAGLTLSCGVCFSQEGEKGEEAVVADDEKIDENVSYVEKEVYGLVSSVRPGHVDVVYKKDEKTGEEWEMGFFVGETVKLTRMKSLTEIERDDEVTVKYVEKMEEYDYVNEDGSVEKRSKKTGTEAREIIFEREKKAKLSSGF